MKRILLALLGLGLLTGPAHSNQTLEELTLSEQNWKVLGKDGRRDRGREIQFTDYKGQPALFSRSSLVYAPELKFHNGTIEVDIAIPRADAIGDAAKYVGLAFRVQNDSDFEMIYFRPHRSGEADALQYAAAGTDYHWLTLDRTAPGRYTSPASVPWNNWFRVRVDVEGDRAQVFLNSNPTAALTIKDLKHGDSAGAVGLYSKMGRSAWFSNLKVSGIPRASDSVVATASSSNKGTTGQPEEKKKTYEKKPAKDDTKPSKYEKKPAKNPTKSSGNEKSSSKPDAPSSKHDKKSPKENKKSPHETLPNAKDKSDKSDKPEKLVLALNNKTEDDRFQKARLNYEKRFGNFEESFDHERTSMNERFTRGLERLKAHYRDSGDLNGIIKVRHTFEHLQKHKSLSPSELVDGPETLKDAQEKYLTAYAKLKAEHEKKTNRLQLSYISYLDKLKIRLTRDDMINDALTIRKAIEEVEANLVAAPALPRPRSQNPVVTAVPTGRSPGRLVVFGRDSDGEPMEIPEELLNKPMVKVSAGYNNWLALGADGKVGGHVQRGYEIPNDKPVIDIECGRHMHVVLNADRTITPISNSHHVPTFPKNMKNVKTVSSGHSLHLALSMDGKVRPFGYQLRSFDVPDPRGILNNVELIACGGHGFWLKKRDGSVVSSDLAGKELKYRPDELDGKKIVDMRSGVSSHGCLMLTDKGRLISWSSHSVPDDLKLETKEFRVGYAQVAHKKRNGTWEVFGKEPAATHMNRKLKELGPLKDLAIGSSFFVGIQ
ncbi:MAG: family 16 glycoside hydrolase [Verrucomicrobiota bacterium]